MNQFLRRAAFISGLAVLLWVGFGYGVGMDIGAGDVAGAGAGAGIGHRGTQWLAVVITALIGAFYLMGAVELHRYRQATAALVAAVDMLTETPTDLRAWLASIPASLRNTVRRRVEGESAGFAGPSLAPYLAGLLVLLGMLGTFIGMVLTLRGTGTALDSAIDLQAVRTSLVAPVRGLGLAFGTSIAGVATSAALGLMSALARSARANAAQALDGRIATTLRVFSLAHQRENSLVLLQRQAEAMPALVDTLRAMVESMDRQGQAAAERLQASQDAFHGKAEAAYAGLAASVDRSLRDSLREGARVAGETIRPVVEATMSGIARETAALHATLAHAAQAQADRAQAALEGSAAAYAQRSAAWLESLGQRHVDWQGELASTMGDMTGKAAALQASIANATTTHLEALSARIDRAHADLQATSATRESQHLAAIRETFDAMRASLRDDWQRVGELGFETQQRLCDTLTVTARDLAAQAESHNRATLAEIDRLLQAAAAAPRAAAEVIAELREKLSDSIARDNALLDERSRMLETLGSVLDGVNHAAIEQRSAIDTLVASSASMLDRAVKRLDEQVDAGAGRLTTAAAQVGSSAIEVASLGEAFGFAVQLFTESNDTMVSHLQRIDDALDKSLSRSDEQLAYYVAQAREVVDLSILSQRQIIEELQRLGTRPANVDAVEATA